MADAAGMALPSVEQLDLIADGACGPQRGVDRLTKARRTNARGRPHGSKNKRNEKVRAWMVGRYGHPLDVLGQLYSMPVDALMRLMAEMQNGDAKHKPIRAIDALRLKKDAAVDALPYIEGKQPLSIEVNGRKDAVIIIPNLADPTMNLDKLVAGIEQFGLSALDPDNFSILPPDDDDDDDGDIVDGEFDEIGPDDDTGGAV